MKSSSAKHRVTLFSQTAGYRIPSLISVIFVIIEVLCAIFIPRLTAQLIDNGITNSRTDQIWMYSGIILALAILSLCAGITSGYFASKATAGVATNLRHNMFVNIENFSFANFDKYSKASLITRLTNDITNIQNAYMMMIRGFIRAPFMLVGAIIMAFTSNVKLALVLLGVILIVTILLVTIIYFSFPRFSAMLKGYDQLNSKAKENIAGIKTIKAFVTEEKELEEFKKTSEWVKKLGIRAEKLVALNSPLMIGTIFISLFFIMLVATWQIARNPHGEMTIGILASFVSYMFQTLMALMMASFVFVSFTIAKASANRILEVLNEEPVIKNCANPVYELNKGSIRFENAFLQYGGAKKPTLKDLNLTINAGETIGVIGATGSAKSSFVNLIPRLYDVTSGALYIDDINVKDYDLTTLRDNVGIVLQKNTLFKGTIRENMQWGKLDATDEEIIEALKNASAYEFVMEKEGQLDAEVEEKGNNFSGGQKQRLCIARALIKKPKIIILDDSTSAVDNKTDKKIRTAFNEKLQDTTKIIIAQRISSIENASRIIVMKKSRVIDFDTHENLLNNNEFYRGLYESQTNDVE
ncbi:ABC transporter ATP-binding protein [Mycoplasma hafezii]|uniref:ABC transporter ATP-binding protein n=1 Tax=Mycoplasma hafezii TaxID=525886 RepID=UPI003CE688FF